MAKPNIWTVIYAKGKKPKTSARLERAVQILQQEVADLHSIVRLLNERLAKLEQANNLAR